MMALHSQEGQQVKAGVLLAEIDPSKLKVELAQAQGQLEKEKATLEAEIARLREVHSQKLSKEAQKLMKMPFQRAITKKEQADMGKLKKSVRGLVVVHPMTALGREMGLQEMTGFSKTAF
nr:YibL family ribosome-associated protein [Escherichia coli]